MTRIGAAAWLRPAAALLSLVLLAIAWVSPIWLSRLSAPQYPKGLWLVVSAGSLAGDVSEVNELNHYIGMRVVSADAVPELQLWWLGIASSAAFAIAALVLRGRLAWLARAAAWLVPLTVIADIQRWLFVFGHELSTDAALRMKPFTPLAVGPTKVWNFEILALPGPGLLILFLVALLVTLVPLRPSPPRLRFAAGPALSLMALLLVSCSPAASRTTHADAVAGVSPFDLAAAIAAAPEGGTIHVPAGRYAPVVIARSVSLHGDGDAVIDGGGHGKVVTVAAPDVTVRGLVVTGSGGQVEDGAGIAVTADGVTITGNRIVGAYVGVLVRDAKRVKITDNVIAGPGGRTVATEMDHLAAGHVGDGIWLHATDDTLVRGNQITGMRDGVYVSYARETLVDTNRVHDLRYGVHAMFGSSLMLFGNVIERNASGLVLMNVTNVEASRNTIADQRSDATGYGVLLKDAIGVRLVENVIVRDTVAVRAEGVDRAAGLAEILKNRIANNVIGMQLFPSARLVISRNAFVGNVVNVDTPGAAMANGSEWMKSGAGNTWDDYAGYDLDGDGVGDLPHVEGTTAQRVVTADPALRIFRGTIASLLIARSERWWETTQSTRVIDRLPLVVTVAPDAPEGARTSADALAVAALAVALLGSAVGSRALIR